MPFAPARPLRQPTYQSMLFDGTVVSAAEIAYALESALTGRMLARAEIVGLQEGDSAPQWRITIRRPDGSPDSGAVAGMWFVVASTGKIRVLNDLEYRAEFAVE